MTSDPRTSWGTATTTRPEPLPDRRYPRCGRMGPEHAWHGLPKALVGGVVCPTSIEDVDGAQIKREGVA